jgi:type VI secretion system secreted protein VgrG
MVLEASMELTVKAGGSWIKIDPSGIRMGGRKVNLGGGGSLGNGSGAEPELPEGHYDEQVVAVSRITNKPIVNYPYFIQTESGQTYSGRTDEAGCTQRIVTPQEEKFEIFWGEDAIEKGAS